MEPVRRRETFQDDAVTQEAAGGVPLQGAGLVLQQGVGRHDEDAEGLEDDGERHPAAAHALEYDQVGNNVCGSRGTGQYDII